jgi:nucleoside-diphosphate-sugar epimerase
MDNEMLENVLSMEKGTRVLVTGATGFTGSLLVRKLAAAGLKVHAIARPSSNILPFQDLNIRWFRGQVFDPETVRAAIAGTRFVFHLAAAYREAKLSYDDYLRAHVTSTQLLADAAANMNEFARFVHISTVGVHGHIDGPPANEESPFCPGDDYQKTKAEGERWLRDFAGRHNLDYTVIRPAGIYGPGDKRLLKVFKMATWPVFPLLGKGRCLYHLIHVEDLTDAIIIAATHASASSQSFICGNPEAIPLEVMGKCIAHACGCKFRPMRLPAWPFFAAGAFCEGLCRPLGIEPIIYRRRVAFYTKDRSFDTRKLQNMLGYRVRFSNDEGLRATARWYRDAGWLK